MGTQVNFPLPAGAGRGLRPQVVGWGRAMVPLTLTLPARCASLPLPLGEG